MKVNETLYMPHFNMAPAQCTDDFGSETSYALQLIWEYAIMGRQQQTGRNSNTVCSKRNYIISKQLAILLTSGKLI